MSVGNTSERFEVIVLGGGKKGSPIAWFVGFDIIPGAVVESSIPRRLRIQYAGAMYHVICRGDRREKKFLDDVDRQDFIKTLAEACQKTGWRVHAFCP
ncbi:MAG TPA: hypothetical protein VN673_15140 [Clostridia bacterium]|nr:hypothetical protein [Clostridia bacterium]